MSGRPRPDWRCERLKMHYPKDKGGRTRDCNKDRDGTKNTVVDPKRTDVGGQTEAGNRKLHQHETEDS